MIIDVLLYLFTHEVEHTNFIATVGLTHSIASHLENSLGAKKLHAINTPISSTCDNIMLLPHSTKQKLYMLMLTRIKRELTTIMTNILVENDMYVVN